MRRDIGKVFYNGKWRSLLRTGYSDMRGDMLECHRLSDDEIVEVLQSSTYRESNDEGRVSFAARLDRFTHPVRVATSCAYAGDSLVVINQYVDVRLDKILN